MPPSRRSNSGVVQPEVVLTSHQLTVNNILKESCDDPKSSPCTNDQVCFRIAPMKAVSDPDFLFQLIFKGIWTKVSRLDLSVPFALTSPSSTCSSTWSKSLHRVIPLTLTMALLQQRQRPCPRDQV
jgi:hypothetical protein